MVKLSGKPVTPLYLKSSMIEYSSSFPGFERWTKQKIKIKKDILKFVLSNVQSYEKCKKHERSWENFCLQFPFVRSFVRSFGTKQYRIIYIFAPSLAAAAAPKMINNESIQDSIKLLRVQLYSKDSVANKLVRSDWCKELANTRSHHNGCNGVADAFRPSPT